MIESVAANAVAEAREAQYLHLFEHYGAAVRRLAATSERDVGLRQDLVQEIWLAVWQGLPLFRGDCSERTFVFRIAHNRTVSHIQRWRRGPTVPLDVDAPVVEHGADPERMAAEGQRRARLQAAVRSLPLSLRQVVMLTFEGLSHREIADVVGISENNVAVRLTRARAALAERLDARGAAR
jgi:RNA polymerase sigma-70 factor (ECF subfamily)